MTPETVYAAIAHGDQDHRAWLLSALRAVWCGEAAPPVASPPEPVREHDLQDVRCECCGYMTYHLEHMGCIRAARAPADSVPAVEREQERIAFKDAHRHLELYEVPDAWGRPMFKHTHVEASWLGWIARAGLLADIARIKP